MGAMCCGCDVLGGNVAGRAPIKPVLKVKSFWVLGFADPRSQVDVELSWRLMMLFPLPFSSAAR